MRQRRSPKVPQPDSDGMMPAGSALDLILEKDFQATVIEKARACGWMVFWTWHSVHSPKGEPDLRLVRPPRVIFAELKTMKGQMTPDQREARDLLIDCPGVEWYLFRPNDWDQIDEVLE